MIGMGMRTSGFSQADIRLSERIAALQDMRPEMELAAGILYEQTRQHFDSQGGGLWPPLAPATVRRKTNAGFGDPERALFEHGDLYESVTSPTGPYSYMVFPTNHSVVVGVDWEEGGWQIPMVLSQGAGMGGGFPGRGNWVLPARPIWPNVVEMTAEIGLILLARIKGI